MVLKSSFHSTPMSRSKPLNHWRPSSGVAGAATPCAARAPPRKARRTFATWWAMEPWVFPWNLGLWGKNIWPIHWVAASHQDWGYLWNFGYGVELETPYPPYEMVLYVMFCIVSCECQLHVFQQKRHPHSNWSRLSYTEYASQPVILIYVGWTGGNILL